MVIIPEGAYRCLILDSDLETARFRSVKNKRRINAFYMSAPRHVTPYRDSAGDMQVQS